MSASALSRHASAHRSSPLHTCIARAASIVPEETIRHRRLRAPSYPLVYRPNLVRVVGLLLVGEDGADPGADALLVPGVICQRLERLRLVEHYATAEAGASRGRRRETIWETPS